MRIILTKQKINRNRHYQGENKGLLAKAQGVVVSQKMTNFPRYPLSRYAVPSALFFFIILLTVFVTSFQNNKEPAFSEHESALLTQTGNESIKVAGLGTDLLNLQLPDIRLTNVKLFDSTPSDISDLNPVKIEVVDWTVQDQKAFATPDKSQVNKESNAYTNTNKFKKPNRVKKSEKVITDDSESLKSGFPQEINISFSNKSDGRFVSTHLSLASELTASKLSYIWDLGDGRKSYADKLVYTYTRPGLYQVQLTVRNEHGIKAKSNVLNIKIPAANELAHSQPEFITLNKMDDFFYTNKRIIKAEDALNTIEQPIKLISENNGVFCYQPCAPGFFSLTFVNDNDEGEKLSYLFVSPFESVHSDRSDINWYRTQFGTGLSNCGPATASMGISWASGQYVDVKDVREYIGWQGNGATSFDELRKTLAHYGVSSAYTDVKNQESIFKLIDRGNIAIILYHCGGIPLAKSNPENDLVGRYYADSVGHYIVIKGYSVDKQYFIVYDPIPSDWNCNGKRYGDGVSMLGRNRYYPANLLMKYILTNYVLEVTRDAS